MKKLFLFILTLFPFLVNAQQRQQLWPSGNIPNYHKTTDVERWDSTDAIRIHLVQIPDITIFLPAKKAATGQAVIICPGGAYSYLTYDSEGTDVAKWLNSKGIAAFVLKYRLPKTKSNDVPHLSPLLDAQRAIRMVRSNAAKWNIKKDQIGIMGFSAGGHLASTSGTHFDPGNPTAKDSIDQISSRPDFMVLVYPVITMVKSDPRPGTRSNLIGTEPSNELATLYSNELQVKKDTPPAFIIHATDDVSVPVENSLLFYSALKNNGVSAEMHIYPKGGHGFSMAIGKGALESWTERCIDWLRSLNK